ncbi:AI-2E family transporter [Sediminibacterium ginsengisoli]|uniref:Predicted PurR-regulated permease PerM n=1 Tax=Sediminibacterium ginsengisoli TaxID=413434 RepID=A0A1T4N351_9BACT|nr:AI-2E family transporter [Sediminibacterium ginsengisoli]SJZ73487.1 Predicted PurR-regulated permease PerM [Sediminibacterium ginsengisoli]
MENRQDHKINRYFFLGVILLLGAFLLMSLSLFFTAFLGALMFYVLSKGPVEWLVNKKKWQKSWAAVLVIVVSFFIILLPISVMGTMLVRKVFQLAANMDTIITPLRRFDAMLQERFHFTLISDKNIAEVQSFITGMLSLAVNQGLNFFSEIIMMYFFLYFMIMNINRMEAAIIFYLPFPRSKIILFGNELRAQTFSNAVGIPLIAVVQGVFGYFAYLLAGLDEPGFWGILTGFSSIIPIIGTGLAWIPASLILLLGNHTWAGIFVFAWGLIVLSSLDNVVRFLLAKRMADVHPIVTVLGVIIGLQYFGITGLIFGPLIISYFIILLRIYYLEYQKPRVQRRTRPVLPSYFQLPFAGNSKKKKMNRP